MKLNERIINLLTTKPSMTANDICSQLDTNLQSVKVTLHRLTKSGKLVREKKAREVKTAAGPQSLYIYKVNANA